MGTIRNADSPKAGDGEKVGLSWTSIAKLMAKPYEGGKRRHHFTLSIPAYEHLCRIAGIAKLSRSEALERLLRASSPHDAHIISDDIWPEILDHTDDQP